MFKHWLGSKFPLDEMHLVNLGVMRRLIKNFWLEGRVVYKCRLSGYSGHTISDRLLRMQRYMCNKLVWKAHSLSEVDRWKATEFCTFLQYFRPVELRGILPISCYCTLQCTA